MKRLIHAANFQNLANIEKVGLSAEVLALGVSYAYEMLDTIDDALTAKGEDRLIVNIELANLSSLFGNLLRSGVSKASKGLFVNNGPHRFPDLLHSNDPRHNVEIKMAFQDNNPKGHLAKEGYHLTCRYVLTGDDGRFNREIRGFMISVWELRFGYLRLEHFNISNTAGDSGKTAVINAAGLVALAPIYCNLEICPLPQGGKRYREFANLFGPKRDVPPPPAR